MKEVMEMLENITNAKLVALYEVKEEITEKINPDNYEIDSFEEYVMTRLMLDNIIDIINNKIDELRCPF